MLNFPENLYNSKYDTISFSLTQSIIGRENLDYTGVLLSDSYAWIGPKPNEIPRLQLLISLYHKNVWYLIITSLLICTFVLWLTASISEKHYNDIFKCLAAMISATLTGNSFKVPKTLLLKAILVLYMFYSMPICFLYQAKLMSALTVTRYDLELSSLEELVETNLTIYTHVVVNDMLSSLNDNRLVARALRNSKITDSDNFHRLEQISLYQNQSTVALLSSFMVVPSLKDQVTIIGTKYLVPVSATYPMKKGHILFTPINKMINRIIESGFVTQWMNERSKVVFLEETKEEIVLAIEHLWPAFLILFLGVGVSVFVFVLEVVWFIVLRKWQNEKRSRRAIFNLPKKPPVRQAFL